MNVHNLKVGQELYWTTTVNRSRYGGNDCWVTIEKVGRKWAHLINGHRIELENLIADGGGYSSPGRCYMTREEVVEERKVNKLWQKIKNDTRYLQSPDCSYEDLCKITALLKLEIEDEEGKE